jgi:hypothetical protein
MPDHSPKSSDRFIPERDGLSTSRSYAVAVAADWFFISPIHAFTINTFEGGVTDTSIVL